MIVNQASLIIAIVILVATYALVMLDRHDRSLLALLGGGAMVLTGVMHQDEAIRGIDFNTIGLLTGMMLLVAISRRSGVFEFLAVWSAQAVQASPMGLLAALALVTALLSALLDNVTTVLLVAPVTIGICRRLGVAPFPFLFSEVMASNIGGTATLIGDPPNILIGSSANLSFNDFLIHMLPLVIVVMVAQTLALHIIWGRKMVASAAARAAVMALRPADNLVDARLLRHSIVVFSLVILGFVTSRMTGLEPGTIALMGAAGLMLLENLVHEREHQFKKVTATYAEVDWITIFFFVGLFMVVHGVQTTGALGWLAQQTLQATGGDMAMTGYAVLWVSAILSAIVDNIPFVAAMIPLIKAMAPSLGGEQALLPLWVALSLGACFGGNGTLIGASANLSVAGIAQREGISFGFVTYMLYAAPLMLGSIAMAHVYLYLRYF